MLMQMSGAASTPSHPGPAGEPLERICKAFENAGWVLEHRQVVGGTGGVNPTQLDLRNGQNRRRLLVYSWFITLEGKGRKKNDYRIQTTRTHTGPLLTQPGRLTIGVGWDVERKVFAAFDGWTKRETGGSSSVHIRRSLLDEAATAGWATDGAPWDARCAFTAANAGRLLGWVGDIAARREAALCPIEFDRIDDNHAEIVGDIWARQPTGWLRKGDRIVVIDKKRNLADDSLWQVENLSSAKVATASGRYNRTRVTFSCKRVGKIDDPSIVDLLK